MRPLLAALMAFGSWGSVVAQDPDAPTATFSGRVDLVVMHVNVQDTRGRFVPGLQADAFAVFDDGVREPVSVFLAEDSPVTVGVVIDNSISMRENRAALIAAVTEFATRKDRQDEFFALAFNEVVMPALPEAAPFTQDPEVLRAALVDAIRPQGQTALFDAIDRGLDYAGRGAHSRRVLVVISDGGDNASRMTFDEALRRAQTSNVAIYTVALVDPLDFNARPDRLTTLARQTGGASYRPRGRADVAETLRRVAADIRRTYTVGYAPTRPPDGRYHALKVVVTPPDGRRAVVRTRAGYVAPSPSRP